MKKEIEKRDICLQFLEVSEENISLVSQLIQLDKSESCFSNKDIEGNIIPLEDMANIYLTYTNCYSVSYQEKTIGLLSLTNENEISIFIVPEYQYQGFGKVTLRKFIDVIREEHQVLGEIVAEVVPTNTSSVSLIEHLGFESTEEEREVPIGGKNTVVKKYVLPKRN